MSTILVVEGSLINAQFLSSEIRSLNHLVEVSTDKESAMTQLMTRPFNLVLCDYQLNGGNDCSIIELAKKSSVNRHTPIIFMADNTGKLSDKQDAAKSGAHGWIIKPLDRVILKRIIERSIHKRSA